MSQSPMEDLKREYREELRRRLSRIREFHITQIGVGTYDLERGADGVYAWKATYVVTAFPGLKLVIAEEDSWDSPFSLSYY